ncbi:MAG: TetR/AcrR family transcriptional regulator [Allomuricauda sp.]
MGSKEQDTEEKIKEAARVIFTKKGYAATRTRDIAEEAGINLSLLNYYFRSKEKLFNIIMTEKIQQFFGIMFPIITDAGLSLEEKIEKMADSYINTILKNPDLPIFVLSEIRNNPQSLAQNFNLGHVMGRSSLILQIKERNSEVDPIHFMLNILGMTVFPFISKPLMEASGVFDDDRFQNLMNERKKLIPIWVKAMLGH